MIQNPNFKKNPDGKKTMLDKKKKNTVSCDICKDKRTKCVYEGEGPCKRCIDHNCESECIFGQRQKRGPKKASESTTNMPPKTELQNWGEMLWRLFGDRQAITDHFQNLSNGNSDFGQTIQLGGNFNGGSDLNQENLPNGSLIENSSNNEQEILSGGNLVKNTLGENHGQIFDLIQGNRYIYGDFDRSHSEPTPSTNFGDNTLTIIDKPTVDGDSAGEARSSRTINRQPRRLSRSPSRDNRQTRQVSRNREPISRSPSPNHKASAYSDGGQPNPTLQINIDHLQVPIDPIDPVYYSPNHTEYQFSFNNNSISNYSSASTSAHIPSPHNTLSNQSTPHILPLDLEDANLLSPLYSTSFQSTANFILTPPILPLDFEDANLALSHVPTSFQLTPPILPLDFEDIISYYNGSSNNNI
ncbi:hypothetical protein F8M41_009005 [Gigaspora margarita]|uniref:Zn(2)-C6 fungal-type domain-containing protein n=1 Tax=Gigaspora margarita TaxID=4874 RepID=A0A8H4AVA7_GIGMA|nr:hypothetical protein F8M41_009005 [Gigaspora margarita]